MNRNVTKTWKKPGRRKRARSGGNPNSLRLLAEGRFGKGHIRRRNERIQRRINNKKRLPHG